MILDVGCGARPKGDINVDKFRYTLEARDENNYKMGTKTKADIIATGEYLPFQDSIFNKVISDNSLEHADNITLFLKELVRVSNSEIVSHKEL